MPRDVLAIAVFVVASAVATTASAVATTASPASHPRDELVVGGLESPTSFAFLGRDRIVVAEKSGIVRLFARGRLLRPAFADLRSRVNADGERGLLAIATAGGSERPLVYLYYAHEPRRANTDRSRTMRLVRLQARGDRALLRSEIVILGRADGHDCSLLPPGSDCIPANCRCHTGGDIGIAADGSIFLSTGDATSAGAAYRGAFRAQDLGSLAGKILRVSPTGLGLPTNPFWSGDPRANRSKVWAYGLRNAFRFSVGPGGTVWLGDVGWRLSEEIDRSRGGENFGWPCYEGRARTPGYRRLAACVRLYARRVQTQLPVFEYPRPRGGSAIITGPLDRGRLYFADFVGARLRSARITGGDVSEPVALARLHGAPVAIELGPDGWLYYLTFDRGELRRLRID